MLHVACLINYGSRCLAATLWTLQPATGGNENVPLQEGSRDPSPEDDVILIPETSSTSFTHAPLFSLPTKDAAAREMFDKMFDSRGSIDLDVISRKVRGQSLLDVLSESWRDVDHFNILEKAIIYNNSDMVDLILNETEEMEDTLENTSCFRGAIHLASFLGCDDIVEALLDYYPLVVTLRGQVSIRKVSGPQNDLFSILGYNQFAPNPRLTFQLKWLQSHPHERPVHFAICAGHAQIMTQLISHDETQQDGPVDADREAEFISQIARATERDVFFVDLVRQAASCASSSCLNTLFLKVPDAMYLRDTRGWLLISSGLGHGAQFIRFLMEDGFSVKLLNNIDGKHTVTALHVFYNSFSKDDGIIAKYAELYDVTALLMDMGNDINKETTSFRSHGFFDTPLHILLNHINLLIPSLRQESGYTREPKAAEDAQKFFDDAMKETVLLLLESGFDIRTHQESLLRLLFSNRNYAKRYELSQKWPFLAQNGCGLRNMLQISKILISEGVYLSPRRREMTPSLALINGLRNISAAKCVFNSKINSLQFQMCLQILMENGDNPNIYPFSSTEDTYLATPLVQLLDGYLDHMNNYSTGRQLDDCSVDSVLHVVDILCNFGAKMFCFMNASGIYLKHGVFDSIIMVLATLQQDLQDMDQRLNNKRLRILKKLVIHLAQNGAEPRLYEFAFHGANDAMPASEAEHTLVFQLLTLALYCLSEGRFPAAKEVLVNTDFVSLVKSLIHISTHVTYYATLKHVSKMAASISPQALNHEFFQELLILHNKPRKLTHLCRCTVHKTWSMGFRKQVHQLLLPKYLRNFLLTWDN